MAGVIELVEQGIALASAGGRDDLRARLEATRGRLRDPNLRVLVVGEFKQGKSKLVNALVNAPACAVDDDIATTVPTVVRYGEQPAASVLIDPHVGAGLEGRAQRAERRGVRLDEVTEWVSERGNPGNERGVIEAEVVIPRKILTGGLTLVDSPGVGGLDSPHALATLAALPSAHALLLVTDASQEFTEPELQFLRHALRVSPNVAVVLSKIDLYPSWRQIAEIDQRHLDAVAQGIPLLPVSSDLRLHAARTGDSALNDESGFPALVRHLRVGVLGQADILQRRSVAQDLRSTAEHLDLSMRAELQALETPERQPELVAELEAAKQRADDLRRRSSKWQTTLTDGVGDLISDMEYDLRDRTRAVQREADAAIEAGDPGPVWDEMITWVEQRILSAVADTFVWTDERATWLALQVADHFALDEARLPRLAAEDAAHVLEPVERLRELDNPKLNALQKGYIGLRGSYGGVLMIGLITSIAGLSLINPLSIAAGVIIGRNALKEDAETRLNRRRAEARGLVRKYIDEVVFQVGKQLKDRLRLVQRSLRDHFTETAEQYHRSLSDSVSAAQKAASLYAEERDRRIAQLKGQLKLVGEFRLRADVLGSAPEEVGSR